MFQSNKILVLVFILSLFSAWGQVKFNAPYSAEGIGEINNTGLTFQRGMAGLGVATSSVQFINLTNPALLTRTGYTAMEFGFQGNTRFLQENGQTQKNTDITLSTISFAFPISRTWTSAIGVTPYSTVNYQTQRERVIESTTNAIQKNIGSGGISKVYFSNGKQLLMDTIRKVQLYAGLEMNYLFGLVQKNQQVQLVRNGIKDDYFVQQSAKTHYSDFTFRPGLALRKEIRMRIEQERKTVRNERNRPYYDNDTLTVSEYPNAQRITIKNGEISVEKAEKPLTGIYKYYLKEETNHKGNITRIYEPIDIKQYGTAKRVMILEDTLVNVEKIFKKDSLNKGSGIYANLGVVYEHTSQFKAMQTLSIERYSVNNSLLNGDTITEAKVYTTLPTQIQVGISFDKPLPKGSDENGELKQKVWTIGADVAFAQWSQFKDVYGNQPLKNTYKVSVGGEYVPQILSTKFLKRTIYRTGLYYGTLPHQLAVEAHDLGITFGMSMPMGPFTAKKMPRYVNIAFNYGQRGDFNNKLIIEHYFATSLSFTVNNKWFQRYKVGL